ncbi:unnamed protein product, partial [Symbiodinium pilosum]
MFLERCLEILKRGDETREVFAAHAACVAICCWFDHVERAPRYLSDEQVTGITKAGTTFLRAIELLARIGVAEQKARWKLLPKAHAMAHIIEDQHEEKYNSRFYHCYADEDAIGQWKKLVIRVNKSLLEFRCLS